MSEPLSYRPVEVAEMTHLSEPFIYKLIAQGTLPSVRVGRAILVMRDDLLAFMQANRTGGAS
jgi:excisionase family DNA binding protein